MNSKYVKKITAFAVVILVTLPLSVKAQIQTHYEPTPKFSHEELTQILAPIALYPDALLSQVLIAASYPFEVAEADRWLARNPYLTDEALDSALQAKNWDVSVLSLCYYPKVLNMMAENLNWTAKLGDAFVYQQQDVMDTVQELRARASTQGNLVSTNEQRVIVQERIIRIEPAYYNYLYVPVYDPFVVYGPWWYPAFLPFRIFYPGVMVVGPGIVFSPRLFIGFGVIGWSLFDWPSRNVVIVNIDRTKRFNRNYHVYQSPQRIYWKPNQQKRVVRNVPVKQSPTFRSPVRQQPQKVVIPPGGKPSTPAPPVINKDQRPVQPQPRVIDKDRRSDNTPRVTDKNRIPPVAGPLIIDRGKTQPQTQPEQPQPRVTDRNKLQPQTQPVQRQPQPTVKPQPQPVQPQSRPGKRENIVDDKIDGRQVRDTNGYGPRSGFNDRNDRGGRR